jgi:hypothetical protein
MKVSMCATTPPEVAIRRFAYLKKIQTCLRIIQETIADPVMVDLMD